MTDPRDTLIAAATRFYQQGWMAGTAGNLSHRHGSGTEFWITASGRPKGALKAGDFLRIGGDGTLLEGPGDRRPSAETSIHQAIYELFPEARACFHVHTIESNLLTDLDRDARLRLPPLEMIKAFGVWEEAPEIDLDVFENHLDVPRIAADIRQRFRESPPKLPALLIRHHGLTTWADTAERATHQVELLDYLFRYMVARRRL